MSLSRQFLLNIFSSWYAHAIRLVIAFFFVPYITSILGDSRYGVWVITFQAINYFTLLDLGMNAALIRFVSKFLGEKNFEKINRVINTALFFYLGVGIVVAALIFIFANYFFGILRIDISAYAQEGATAMSILGIYLGIRLIMVPLTGSLVAFQRLDIANAINVIEEIFRTIAMIVLLFNGYGLVEMAEAVLIINIAKHVVAVVILKRLHSEVKIRPAQFDKDTFKSLFDYSKTAFGISAAWILIFNSDSLLLGIVSSTAAAGVFNPAVQVMYNLRMIVNAIGIPLTPAVSHLDAVADTETIARMYLRGLKYTSYLTFLICTGVVLYSQSFIMLWLPEEFSSAAGVMQILAISGAFYLPQILGNSVLLGLDKHKYLLSVLLIEVTSKVALAIVLIKPYGLIGMAIATAIPQLILYTTVYPNYVARVLGLTFTQVMRPVLISGLIATVMTGIAGTLATLWMPPETWKTLITNVLIVLIVNIVPAYLMIEKKDLDKLKSLVKRKAG